MNDPSAEMQKAIHAKLTTHAAMLAVFGGPVRAFDKTPLDPAYPYLRIGDDDVRPRGNSCVAGWDHTATVHIYSRDPIRPRMQAKEISDAIAQAIATLATAPAPTGYVIKELDLVQARTYYEADGVTAHGILSVEYLVRPA